MIISLQQTPVTSRRRRQAEDDLLASDWSDNSMLSYDWLRRRDKRSASPGPGPVERLEGVSMLIPRSIMTGVLPAAPEPIMSLDTGKN